MLGTDTAYRDLMLLVAGFLAAAFFYWFFPSLHPFNAADGSLGKEKAHSLVSNKLTSLGYIPSEDSFSSFKADNQILSFKQKQQKTVGLEQIKDSAEVIAPPFHWNTIRKITIDERAASLMGIEAGQETVEMNLSESGEFLSFQNTSATFPSRILEEAFFENHYPELIPEFQQFRTDSEILKKFQFHFNSNADRSDGKLHKNDSGIFELTEKDAVNIALYHLSQTGWSADSFSVNDTEMIVHHGVDVARVVFTSGDIGFTELQFDVLPTGALVNLGYNFTGELSADETWSDIRYGALIIVVLMFAIWVLILLFIRIRHRLIDTKLAVLVAVLVGFLLPMQFLFEWIFEYFYLFDEFSVRQVFTRLFGLGFIAALGSVCYFATTAVGDSVTRDNWSEKLRTFDLIRIGKIYNHPVGMVLVRSVVYSYIMVAIFAIFYSLMPEAYIDVTETFRSDRFIFPSITVLTTSVLLFILLVQSFFLITVGKLRAITKNGAWIVLVTGLLFALIGFLPIEIGPWNTDMIVAGFVGLAAGWIYLKEDFLTIFFTLSLMGIHLLSAPGWVMADSPDSFVFYFSLFIITTLAGIGLYGLYKGKPIDQLPEYVPEYINELKKDERIKQELQIAREVQKSFLPEKMPLGNGFEFAAVCRPALETGGDYYDFIEIDKNHLGVAIGDVSGKGIQAAFYMTFTKGVLHALCRESISTVQILSKINDLFIKNARKGTFISLIFGVIDMEKGSFRFSRGGHNPLLHFSAKKGSVEEYRPSGIGLGMTGNYLFNKNTIESEINLEKDDLIVLFTDGVVEATSPRGEFYGNDRLHSIIKRYSKLSADEIVNKLSADLHEFGDGSEMHDDMTAIVIKKK